MRPRPSACVRAPLGTLLAALAVALAAPAVASASPTFIFSQSASEAWVSPAAGGRVTLALRTGHAPALAIEERPGRRVGLISERGLLGLWRGTFRTDPPNAVITGLDRAGRTRRAVVVLRRAARLPGGVRYRARVLRGTIPRRMSAVALIVDGVPWESVINSIVFPEQQTVFAGEDFLVRPGDPLTLTGPVTVVAETITLLPGSSLVLRGSGSALLSAQAVSGPEGSSCQSLSGLGGIAGATIAPGPSGSCTLSWGSLGPGGATLSLGGGTPLVLSGVRILLG